MEYTKKLLLGVTCELPMKKMTGQATNVRMKHKVVTSHKLGFLQQIPIRTINTNRKKNTFNERRMESLILSLETKWTSVKYLFFLPVFNNTQMYTYMCLKIWQVMNRYDINI